MKIPSHLTKFISLKTKKNHLKPSQENMVDENNSKPNSCNFFIETFTCVTMHCPGGKALFCALILAIFLVTHFSDNPIILCGIQLLFLLPFSNNRSL